MADTSVMCQPNTLYNRWSDMGEFARIMIVLAEQIPDNKTISIDATYLKAHRTAFNPQLKKGARGRLIGLTKIGVNSKLHAFKDTRGRPICLFITAGQVSVYISAAALVNGLPEAKWLLGGKG
jgi:transposase|tara:strand:+ start:67 stop:435 length:369 start_codon:yes stop_codon:yes gene_type:complete